MTNNKSKEQSTSSKKNVATPDKPPVFQSNDSDNEKLLIKILIVLTGIWTFVLITICYRLFRIGSFVKGLGQNGLTGIISSIDKITKISNDANSIANSYSSFKITFFLILFTFSAILYIKYKQNKLALNKLEPYQIATGCCLLIAGVFMLFRGQIDNFRSTSLHNGISSFSQGALALSSTINSYKIEFVLLLMVLAVTIFTQIKKIQNKELKEIIPKKNLDKIKNAFKKNS